MVLAPTGVDTEALGSDAVRASASTPMPGDVLGAKWRVEHELGRGGMGVVFAATHVTLGDEVALKLLLPSVSGKAGSPARLLREAKAARAITGDRIARVLDVDSLPDGTPYIVFERLVGETLATRLGREGRLSNDAALRVAIEIAHALRDAHAAGVVHRDLKPSNVFLVREGASESVKLLDFGIAKALEEGERSDALTGVSAVLGSPAYMSPEQLRSARTVDERTDLWSFGVTMFEALTGALPFVGETSTALALAIAGDSPRALRPLCADPPPELERAIAVCLIKSREKRLSDAAGLCSLLRERPRAARSLVGASIVFAFAGAALAGVALTQRASVQVARGPEHLAASPSVASLLPSEEPLASSAQLANEVASAPTAASDRNHPRHLVSAAAPALPAASVQAPTTEPVPAEREQRATAFRK